MDRIKPVIIILIFLAVATLVVFPVFNYDIFWHMAMGRAMLDEGRIINEEVFSYTVEGTPFVNHKWLFQLLTYSIYETAGAPGLVAFKVLMVLLVSFFLYRTARFLKVDGLTSSLMVLFVVLAGLSRYTVRPQLFSFLFMSVLFFLLFGFRAGRVGRKALFAIPVMMVLWDFFHGAIYGVVLLGAFVTGETAKTFLRDKVKYFRHAPHIEPSRLKTLWMVCALTALAMAVNPYGLRTYLVFSKFAGGDVFAKYIWELQPTATFDGHLFYWVLLAAVTALVLAFIRKMDLTLIAMLVPFAFLSIKHVRVTAVFAIISLPALGYYFNLIESRVTRPAMLSAWRWCK